MEDTEKGKHGNTKSRNPTIVFVLFWFRACIL